MHYRPIEDVYVYFRYDKTSSVMVILNASDEKRNIDFSRFSERIKKNKLFFDVFDQKNILIEKQLEVSAKTPIILTFKTPL